MAQESVAPTTADVTHGDEQHGKQNALGPILCWAVVFADIGTSIYYTPGILYHNVQGLAGFFVFLTMAVFVLLTLKYTEVSHRFPQGGGVVTVAAHALNPWFGALGGMFILVDYFLTATISCLSGVIYLSVVFPALHPWAEWVTIGVLILLGLLNWVGISESAKVSLIGAAIAFVSDIAILITVFTHISFGEFLALFPRMFQESHLTFPALLVGFGNAFLAFSGLESISQLSPVMKLPRKKTAGLAMFLVVLTIGITSPLLTTLSTMLLKDAAQDPVRNEQIISLLAGHWGNTILQAEVAISAGALLIFASNTAIIGAYHVFMALARMEFLPSFLLKRNKLRNTPHFAILLAVGVPIAVLILVQGNLTILGDMYAFGLLGAFALTCLGLDIIRARDWKKAREAEEAEEWGRLLGPSEPLTGTDGQREVTTTHDLQLSGTPQPQRTGALAANTQEAEVMASEAETKSLWFKIDYFLGILTTLLVTIAWTTNLVTKHLATIFGGVITIIGMGVAYLVYIRAKKVTGRVPVPIVVTRIEGRIPNSVLAILLPDNEHNKAVIRAAITNADQEKPIMFVYLSNRQPRQQTPRMMEIVDPYLEDTQAKQYFGRAESLAQQAKVPLRRYVYLQGGPESVTHIWQIVNPHDTVIAASDNDYIKDINPDRIRYELTPYGKVAHLLKTW